MDKIILGHNQFFGVNHYSVKDGMENNKKFSDISKASEIIEYAFNEGCTGMMLSTHENSIKILDQISLSNNMKKSLNIHILLPYMNKYVRRLNQIGMISTLNEVLLKNNKNKFSGIVDIGKGLITKDIYSFLKILIDTEMRPYLKYNIKSIFLHNSLTDILSSFQMEDIINFFYSYIKEEYKLSVGFCTLNYPLLQKCLSKYNLQNLNIMLPFNKLGFQMNPDKSNYEELILENNYNFIAMSTMAGGKLNPDEAYKYIGSQKKIKSVVIGSSKIKNIKSSFESIKKFL
jgi:hypothetical protein